MEMSFDFLNIPSSDALKDRLSKKIEKLQKYVAYPLRVHVRLEVEGTDHDVEITCFAEHHQFVAEAKSADMYTAIDIATSKMETQLKKSRDKRKNHSLAHPERAAQDVQATIPHLGKK